MWMIARIILTDGSRVNELIVLVYNHHDIQQAMYYTLQKRLRGQNFIMIDTRTLPIVKSHYIIVQTHPRLVHRYGLIS